MADGSTRAPIAVTCALLERDGRLLVAQRPPGASLALKWEFPGGKVEPGESGPEALVRELREELGIEVDVERALPGVTHDYGTAVIHLQGFICRVRSGEAHPHEHAAVRWCTPVEIAALDLAAADLPVLRHYLVLRGQRAEDAGQRTGG